MSPSKVSSLQWDKFSNVINGQLRDSKDHHYGTNPSTGEKLWPVPIAGQKDVDEAVEVAQKAFESFRETTLDERKALLTKFKDALLAVSDEMTELLCAETGKPVSIRGTHVIVYIC
jgi:acyl-CoA reductase-like NAD-dependent aldehyde dehydrogenase